jgi:hypothetical protein
MTTRAHVREKKVGRLCLNLRRNSETLKLHRENSFQRSETITILHGSIHPRGLHFSVEGALCLSCVCVNGILDIWHRW